MNIRRIVAIIFIVVGLFLPFTPSISLAESDNYVYVIPVKDEITPTMAVFLSDEIQKANDAGAEGIIIEITTLGGRVDSTLEMTEAIMNSDVDVSVYVQNRAVSAGALITISADTIFMAPGSHIGAAEPRPYDEKTVSFVKAEFRGTAEARGRRTDIAEAMVDKNIEIDDLVAKGEILSLTASEAKEYEYAEAILDSRQDVLEHMGWDDADVVETDFSLSMRLAQFMTSYVVASLLLSIGTIAIFTEITTQGFGAPGIVGIICFFFYFGGNLIAGYSEWWPLLLFIAGLGMIAGEIIAPGFGVLGIGGFISVIAGIVLSAPDLTQGLTTIGIALVAAIIFLPILFIFLSKKTNVFKRFILSEAETVEDGYVNASGTDTLLGKKGKAVTTLRPTGTVLIDGKRVDVVTEGEFLPIDTEVKVVRVEGSKIVVGKKN
ncbi:nodulation protein NfeD [Herbivorax sp. ANBcel31]|uniref:NfeD family protein n=1 Tax=Herbivorax sp. ANBcel31 TaxID=3069754 RepID=UPI0027B516B0|nr:nodulation protein NfeD [Herbivorax sp. ANBcel31]MDQ2087167.1 nodulation protein NfeD [Herbivorax sp. ANBcel31]